MTKLELRRIYLGKRTELSASDFASLSSAAPERLFEAVDISTFKTLHCYLPIEKFNEPNTNLIFDRIWTNYPTVKTVVPRIDFDSGNLVSVVYSSVCPVVTNKWGVSEPEGGTVVPADEIDIAIVPLLCFDKQGYRVGYGKGYYDRFLAKCRADCLKVGLSFFPPVEKIEDIGEHDIALDVCITSEALYEFNK